MEKERATARGGRRKRERERERASERQREGRVGWVGRGGGDLVAVVGWDGGQDGGGRGKVAAYHARLVLENLSTIWGPGSRLLSSHG